MAARKLLRFVTLLLLAFTPFISFAFNPAVENSPEEKEEKFDPAKLAMEHVLDSHYWHIMDWEGHPISISLPVILWDDGLRVFMSSEFDHGHAVVQKGDAHYVLHHEKIYRTDALGTLSMDEEGHLTNERPLDFSITKNVTSMLIAALIIFLLFRTAARSYKRSQVPKGLTGFLEPLVVFVRDEIAIPNIGEKKAGKFLPYLLTVFFVIWVNNLIGIIPFPPGGGSNVTGSISFTLTISIFTLLLTNFYGTRHYWKHIFDPLGNSFPVGGKLLIYIILVPVEIISILTKPFALMIRLFANITAGHIIILSLTSLIFIFKNVLVAAASVPFVLFISCIELLVAVLQAYVFTLLSALFIGLAVQEPEGAH